SAFRIPSADTHSATGGDPAFHPGVIRPKHQRRRGIYQGHAGRSAGLVLRPFGAARATTAGKNGADFQLRRRQGFGANQTSMKAATGTLTTRRWMLRSFILSISILFAISASAQRDHLTDPETDLVRYYQEIDKRTEVFIKAADRRFAIINGAAQPN